MKLSLDSLKSIDWKRVGVDHGEKIAVGVVGLIVLLILGLGTRWSAYDAKDPQELQETVKSERQALQQATWPDEEKRKYPASYDVRLVVAREKGPVKLDPYDYPLGHAMWRPLTKQQQRYEEPNWLALEYPEIRGDRAYLETGGPDMYGEDDIFAGADGEGVDDDGPGDFGGRFDNPAGTQENGDGRFTPPAGPGPGPGGFPGDAGRGRQVAAPDAPDGGGHGGGGEGPMGGMEFPGMYAEGMAATYPQVEGRSVRYASVRYVFPWKQQIEMIASARGNKDAEEYAKILATFRIAEFELQRQEARPGPQPWSDKDADWETVSREMAKQVLQEVAGFEVDIVDSGDVDPVITMPLPVRLDGRWIQQEAGHSKLKTLDEKEMQLQAELAEALLEQQEKLGTPENVVELGGFYGVQADVTGARRTLYGDQSARSGFMMGMYEGVGEDMAAPGQFNSLQSSLATIPEYVLFRYFDFDVKPGVAYRYRARLILTNPNFNMPLEMVSRPEIAQGKTRTTPWSKPTPPAVIPPDVEVYLEDVDVARGTPATKMKVIQWLPEVGTLVKNVLEIVPGARIAGRSSAEVVEPGVTLQKREVAFAAPTIVVDTEAAPPAPSDRKFHGSLKLDRLEAVEQTLVVNESGEMEVLTPYTDEKERKRLENYHDGLLNYFAGLRPAEMTDPMEGGGLDFLDGYGGEEDAGGYGGGYGGGQPSPSRPRNPLGRPGRRGSSGPPGGGGHGEDEGP